LHISKIVTKITIHRSRVSVTATAITYRSSNVPDFVQRCRPNQYVRMFSISLHHWEQDWLFQILPQLNAVCTSAVKLYHAKITIHDLCALAYRIEVVNFPPYS